MTPGHDQTIPATPERALARSASTRRGTDSRPARPPSRTLEIVWSVGRRALEAARPDLGISSRRGSVTVDLQLRLTVRGDAAELVSLELVDGDRRSSIEFPSRNGSAITDLSAGLVHITAEGLRATFDSRTGRPVYVSSAIPGEMLGLRGGRYELTRAE